MEITALTHEDSCPKQTVLPNKIIHKIQLIENKEVILFVQLNW